MRKVEFLNRLRALIGKYPYEELEKSLEYYSEMIDDRMEDGMTEEEAVASLGSAEEIAQQIMCELPLTTIVKYKAKEKAEGKKFPVWAIILIIVGSPLLFPLAIGLGATVFGFYVAIWSVVFAFWAVSVSLGVSSLACIIAFITMIVKGSILSAVIYFGATLFLCGATILALIASFYVSKGLVLATIAFVKGIKKMIVGK